MSQTTATDERTMLLAYLDAQRNHVLGILEGLSDDDLRRSMLPTGWTCVGLVNHLALDVERFWFRNVVAGESAEMSETSWQVPADVPTQSVFDLYRQEIECANAIIRDTPLDAPPKAWPHDIWPDWRHENLRQTMLHVITETACHAGHLDAARELIDGRTWMVLTD